MTLPFSTPSPLVGLRRPVVWMWWLQGDAAVGVGILAGFADEVLMEPALLGLLFGGAGCRGGGHGFLDAGHCDFVRVVLLVGPVKTFWFGM